ncbi:hypothetical protein [Streptomyces sp. enrichment culture]|uniref:hypothetical protein n=1 Tax=Streptomyces sp. enrichment culture TaxID=1795815 RepID=UPI003F558C38
MLVRPAERTETVYVVFASSRQIGGALAVAVFGALVSVMSGFRDGLRVSPGRAAAVTRLAALVPRNSSTPKPRAAIEGAVTGHPAGAAASPRGRLGSAPQ